MKHNDAIDRSHNHRIGADEIRRRRTFIRPDLFFPCTAFRSVTAGPERAITLLYYALIVTLGFGGAILGPSIQALAQNTGSATEQIAWVFTAKSFGAMTGAFILGRLFDRFRGHRLMAAALLALLPAYALTPLVHHLGILLPLILLAGICEGTLHVGFNTLLVRLHRDRVTPYMNGLHFAFGIGATVSPMLLSISFDLGGGIMWPYLGVACAMLLLLPILFRLPTPEGQTSSEIISTAPPPRRLLPILIAVLFFFYAGIEGSVGNWIYSYAHDLHIADQASAARLTSFFWGGLTLGRLFGISLSRHFAPRHILLANLLGGGLVLTWIAVGGASFFALAAGVTAYGVAIASTFPTLMAFAGIRMRLTGGVTGWFLVGAASGGMLFPWLVGQFFTIPGPVSMLIVAGGSIVMALAVYAWMMHGERRDGRR